MRACGASVGTRGHAGLCEGAAPRSMVAVWDLQNEMKKINPHDIHACMYVGRYVGR